MPLFKYKARDRFGMAVTGQMEAVTPGAVAERLSESGYFPVSIKRALPSLTLPHIPFGHIKPEALIFFTRQLATLLRVGIPILSSFETLARQTKNRRLRSVIMAILRDVEGGSSLSDAMAKHPRAFSEVFLNTIRAGETGGFLVEALERLADLAEHETETKAKIKAATRYPIFVIVAIFLAIGIITTFVVPKFALLYSAFRAQLPLPTRVVLWISLFIRNNWYFILGGILGILGALRLYIRTKKGRLQWDSLKLQAPIFGPLTLKLTMSRFAHILGVMVRCGIPILKSLEIVSRAVGNRVIDLAIERVALEIEKGKTLAEPMSKDPIFPPLVVQMVAVGEKTGELDNLLQKTSEHYDMEAEYTIKNLATALEPVLLVFVGAMVFFLALSVFLPMWDMIKFVRR